MLGEIGQHWASCRTSEQHRPLCRHPLFLYDRKALASVWWWLFKATQRVVVKPLCFVGKHEASPCNSATCEIRSVEHQWGLGLVFITSFRFSQVAPKQMKSFPPHLDVLLLFLFEPCTGWWVRHDGWFLHLPCESVTGLPMDVSLVALNLSLCFSSTFTTFHLEAGVKGDGVVGLVKALPNLSLLRGRGWTPSNHLIAAASVFISSPPFK